MAQLAPSGLLHQAAVAVLLYQPQQTQYFLPIYLLALALSPPAIPAHSQLLVQDLLAHWLEAQQLLLPAA
jgi:hypothetical protein